MKWKHSIRKTLCGKEPTNSRYFLMPFSKNCDNINESNSVSVRPFFIVHLASRIFSKHTQIINNVRGAREKKSKSQCHKSAVFKLREITPAESQDLAVFDQSDVQEVNGCCSQLDE